jgi:8-oxo-dGTP diphosphatase
MRFDAAPGARTMTSTAEGEMTSRRVYFDDPQAPRAHTVSPCAFVAVRGPRGRLLLVRRRDSGVWELPGGRVDVGESAIDAAVRETVEEAGLAVRITGLLGLYTHPGQVVCGVDSAVRQQFAVVFRAVPVGPAVASCDGLETDAVAWVTRQDLVPLDIEPATRIRIDHALARAGAPQLL